jgi:protein TonB
VEAKFPGGDGAWQKYIQKAIQRELDEFTESDYGTCTIRFMVDASGNVSKVEATTMQGTKLAEIAVNTIKKGPKWIPAMQNGRYVTAYRVQPVTLLNPNQ